jgi:hypothetical protein
LVPTAEAKLDHVQLAERHHAGAVRRSTVLEVSVATRFSNIFDPPVPARPAMSQKVLRDDRQAVQRSQREARGARLVGHLGEARASLA